MISSLRAHRAHLAFEYVDCPHQRNFRLFVSLVRDQLPPFGLTANLGLGRAMLMMVTAFYVYNHVNEVLLPFAEFLDS
jgi:hypothetical protein